MMALLRALHAAGRTIVIITHTPWVIAEHAERVLLLEAGHCATTDRRGASSPTTRSWRASFRPPT
jgi:ABC-type ATPase involved in cell division